MRDWFMILTPIVVALYLAAYPDQAQSIFDWAARIIGR